MFDGVPEQFHQFIASSTRTTTLPLPLSFPSLQHHHGSSNTNNIFPSFDPLFPSSHQQAHFLHHQLHQQSPVPPPTHKINGDKQDNSLVGMDLGIDQREGSSSSIPDQPQLHHHPWSNDEVLALLRIRSSMEIWFPEFAWEHVSRKLAELGFKRSAEKCKEKFEEESRCFNNNINYSNKSTNYRIFSELEELCHGDHHHQHQSPHPHVLLVSSTDDDQKKKTIEKPSGEDQEDDKVVGQDLEEDNHQTVRNIKINPCIDQVNHEKVVINERSVSKKRKRSSSEKKHFEIFKGFCENVVNTMMVQQEEMQNKLLEDMVKRDKEKVAREEASKKQEIDRINKELEIRGHEQAIAGDRQSTITNFLKKFITSSSSSFEGRSDNHDPVSYNPQSSSSLVLSQNPTSPSSCDHANNQLNKVDQFPKSSSVISNQIQNSTSCPPTQIPNSLTENLTPQNPNSTTLSPPKVPTSSFALALTPQNPNSLNTHINPLTPTSDSIHKADHNDKDDLGKRWPRDEVLALVNLRCNLYNINGDHHHHQDHKEGSSSSSSAAAAAKATPLWERISQGMLELGYKRNAKRCKEKWENINKYFRKTKDVNKKRSLDSRTCPYFHQLSTLYSQGTLEAPNIGGSENHPAALPENHSADLPETTSYGSSQGVPSDYVADQGEASMVQVPAFGFEF